jgi:ribosomal-protein-alanine N-acetyltransferase
MDIPEIHTERCILMLLQAPDAALLAAFCEQNRSRLAPWEPIRDARFYTLEACAERIRAANQAFSGGHGVSFAVLDPSSGRMIASCNFNNIVRGMFQACHMGYSVAGAHEGRGLMFEAAQAGIDYMFTEMKLHRIMANHLPSNQRSARLLQKLGFEHEGLARAYLKIAGKWEDHVLNALVNPAADI